MSEAGGRISANELFHEAQRLFFSDRRAEAFRLLDLAETDFAHSRNRAGTYKCRISRGHFFLLCDEVLKAEKLLTAVVADLLASGQPDFPLIVRGQFLLGEALNTLGRTEAAEMHFSEAVRNAQQGECDPVVLVECLKVYGNFLKEKGRYSEADRLLERSARTARDTALHPAAKINAYRVYGDLLHVRGRDSEARAWYGECIALLKHKGVLPELRADCLHEYAHLLQMEGELAEATEWLREAARIAQDDNVMLLTRMACYSSYGSILVRQGELGEGERWVRAAAALADKMDLPGSTRVTCFLAMARLLRRQHKYSEALKWSHLAARLADNEQLSGIVRCNAHLTLGDTYSRIADFKQALPHLVRARDLLIEELRTNRWPSGVSRLMEVYRRLFELGGVTCSALWTQSHDDSLLWEWVRFIDARSCVLIREQLRQTIGVRRQGIAQLDWTPGPRNWWELFSEDQSIAPGDSGNVHSVERGYSRGHSGVIAVDEVSLPEQPASRTVDADYRIPELIAASRIADLLEDNHTVILLVDVMKDIVVLLPIYRTGSEKEPKLVLKDNGAPFAREVVAALNELRDELLQTVEQIAESDAGASSQYLYENYTDTRDDIFGAVYDLLELEEVLEAVERQCGRREELHITVIPSGPLFELPLHAARARGRPPGSDTVIDQVGSITYALSLGTLELQANEENARPLECGHIHGTVLASPNGESVGLPPLGHVREEVKNLLQIGAEHWRVFGEKEPYRASLNHARNYHAASNVLWVIAHGGMWEHDLSLPDGSHKRIRRPGALLSDGEVLSDAGMIADGFDLAECELVFFSCCLLGKLEWESKSRQIEGFLAYLTLLRARRVGSAMWRISDEAASVFAWYFIRALHEHAFRADSGRHAFAIAFKRAVGEFRKHERGRWDHEFFWAPYVVYGIG